MTVALAIMAMGAVVLIGLLPGALQATREAAVNSASRRIAQNLIGEFLLQDWRDMHLFDEKGGLRYYDNDGVETPGFTEDTVYTARIRVMPRDVRLDHDDSLAQVPQSASDPLPDDEGVTAFTNRHLRRVVVDVTAAPVEGFDFDAPERQWQVRTFSSVVANVDDTDTSAEAGP